MKSKPYRKAEIRYKDQRAGFLSEIDTGYEFVYDQDFLRTGCPISVSFPPREEPYHSKELFSFFKGLLPEGWYLTIVSDAAKIDPKDSFGLLLATAADTIGAVTVHALGLPHD